MNEQQSQVFGEEVERIHHSRWEAAQSWERGFWDRQNIPSPLWKRVFRPVAVAFGLRPPRRDASLDDRNLWWREQFDGYKALPHQLSSACELGCGPYTNMRLILDRCQIDYVVCSDPLAQRYVTYPNAWLAQSVRSGRVAVDFHPAERSPFRSDFFELTVMINVLDHVRDPQACLDEALRVTAPGGLFVFGQDLAAPSSRRPSNPGHPFLFTERILDDRALSRFECIYRKRVPRDLVHEPEMHTGAVAFIGRKSR